MDQPQADAIGPEQNLLQGRQNCLRKRWADQLDVLGLGGQDELNAPGESSRLQREVGYDRRSDTQVAGHHQKRPAALNNRESVGTPKQCLPCILLYTVRRSSASLPWSLSFEVNLLGTTGLKGFRHSTHCASVRMTRNHRIHLI